MLWRKKNENLKRVRPWKRNSNPDKILHNDNPLAQEKHVEETQEESQMKKLYFCVGCRQVHYDKDYNEKDGDLLILKSKEFLESVERIKGEIR